MKKYFYYTISIERDDLDERPITRRAMAIRVHQNYNLLPILQGIKGLVCVHQQATAKAAEDTANAWNEAYLHNGEYALSDKKIYPCYITNYN